ncbi:MAG: endospore germination permease [Peptococcaceae bacterium]|nr:endospore germination permease [Peptococcaceae bacterium]
MLEGGRISEAELVSMMLYTVMGTAFFFLPSVVAGYAARDVWLSALTGMSGGLLVALVTGSLTSRYPGFNFFDWTEIVLGKAGGKILQFFYVLWFYHLVTVVINEFDYFVQIAFMPVTPFLVFTLLLLALTGAAVYGGVETIGRLAVVFIPVSVVISAGLTVMAAGLYDFANLTPVLERGIVPVLAGTLPTAGWESEIFLGTMLFPFLKRPEKGGWVLFRAELWITFFLLVSTLSVTLAFGEETARLTLPVFSLAREINLLGFFQHLESLVLIMWYASLFVKVAVWEYVTVLGTAQWLSLGSYRPLVLPGTLLLAALTNYDMPDLAILTHFLASAVPFDLLLLTVVVPGILVLVSLVRKRKDVLKGSALNLR